MSRGMFYPRLLSGVVLTLAWCATVEVALPADDVASAVKNLLDVGWQNSPSARREIDTAHAELPFTVRADPNVAYAYALALIKVHRDADAAKVIEDLAAIKNVELGILRTQLWLTMLTKQYSVAMREMERIAGRLAQAAATPEAAAEAIETAGQIGAMFGFLEGPADGAVPILELDACRGRILAPLNKEQADAFAAGRAATKQQYAQLTGQQSQARDDAQEEVDAEKVEVLQAAAVEREQMAARRRELAEQIEGIREKYQSELDQLQANVAPLTEQLAVAVNRFRRDQNELLGVLDDIARLENELRREKDPLRRRRLVYEIDRLDSVASRVGRIAAESERQALLMEAKVVELRRQIQTVTLQFNNELSGPEAEQSRIVRREAQLAGMENRAMNLTPERGRPRALAARAGALTSYASLPLEEEKARLLKRIAP